MNRNVHMRFGEHDTYVPEPAAFVATAADDEDDAPVPGLGADALDALEAFADRVDEADMPVPFTLVDPAVVSQREWKEIESALPLLTVAERREVLTFIRNIRVCR